MSSPFPPPVTAQVPVQPMVNVLVVCAHNRTRSVMAAAMLRHHLGVDPRIGIESAGFNIEGLPALPEAVALLAQHGINVNEHRSRKVTAEMVRRADLILCAEKKHVMAVVADFGAAFEKSYTIPEFAAHRGGSERSRGLGYLASSIDEVEDPTGRTPGVWKSVYISLDSTMRSVATELQRRLTA